MVEIFLEFIYANTFITSLFEINGFKVLINNLSFLLEGAILTIKITVISIAFGMIIGLVTGLFRVSSSKILYYIATIFIDFFRGTPFLVQIFLIYFGILPIFFDNVSAIIAAIVACSLNSGAYIAEIVRAGIQAVDKGQMEAAQSLGMNKYQSMWHIILPQAYKIVIPPLINEFIMLLKDTALVSVIAAEELTHRGKMIVSTTYEAAWIWGGVAIIYLIMTKTLAVAGEKIERRLAKQ